MKAILMLMLGAVAAAQPVEIPVDIALADVRDAYRRGPVVDRIVATFEDERGARATERLTVRIDASAPSPIVAFDLGRLHVSATQGVMTAVHDAEATTCYQRPIDDPVTSSALLAALPPLPAPQVFLALADEPTLTTPHTPGITWRQAMVDEHVRPVLVTLTGRGPAGEASAVIDAATGRLRRFESEVAGGVMRLSLDIAPGDAGDSAAWVIPAGARRPVERLGDLTRPPPDLKLGDPAPNVRAISFPSTTWSLHAAAKESPIAMLSFRAMPPGAHAEQIQRDVLTARDAIIAVLADWPDLPFKLHAVAVFEQVELDLLSPLSQAWSTGVEDERIVRLLPWTQDAVRAIDVIQPDADALLTFVDRDVRIAAIVPLDGVSDEPAALAERVRNILESMRPPEPEPTEPMEQSPPTDVEGDDDGDAGDPPPPEGADDPP